MTDLYTPVAALDYVRKQIDAAPNGHHFTDAEKAESDATHKEVTKTITEIREMIAEVLEEHHAVNHKSTLYEFAVGNMSNGFARAAVDSDPNQVFKKAVETDLITVADTTKKMSESIANVTKDFNTILGLPGLVNFSGTLESVPAVGILGSTVQYVAVTLDASGKTVPNWQQLDALPATPAAGDTTSLFSYRGLFYVAIGKSIWYKTPRAAGDPELFKAATNNWSQIFNPGWQSAGAVLPSNNSRSFIQFAQQSSDGKTLTAYLVRIASDGSLSFSSNPVGQNMTFSPLVPAKNQTLPNLVKAAYYADGIWGYDSANILYELSPNFAAGTFTVKTKTQLTNPITDLTAVDTGIVVTRTDNNLYKLLTIPPKDPNSKITQEWRLWMTQKGVLNLGAASPGVILDLKTLTVALKSTYIDTQTDLFPYINQIQACCASHGVYLSQLLTTAKQWAATTDPAQQAAIAAGEGDTAVKHAKFMGSLVSAGLSQANRMVVNMTRQTSSINSSIAAQLSIIDTKLAELNGSLTTAQAKEKALLAGLWASIAGVIVGLGAIIAGFFFPPLAPFLWAGGGALVVGSMVAVGVVSSELGKVQATISQLSRAIADLTTQKKQLLSIQAAFSKLTDDYGNLGSFWLGMLSASGQIKALESLGVAILQDQASIIAAQALNQQIVENLGKYVDTLGSQGIVPPEEGDEFGMAALVSFAGVDEHVARAAFVSKDKPEVGSGRHRRLQLAVVSELVGKATKELGRGNTAGYLSILREAAGLNGKIHGAFGGSVELLI